MHFLARLLVRAGTGSLSASDLIFACFFQLPPQPALCLVSAHSPLHIPSCFHLPGFQLPYLFPIWRFSSLFTRVGAVFAWFYIFLQLCFCSGHYVWFSNPPSLVAATQFGPHTSTDTMLRLASKQSFCLCTTQPRIKVPGVGICQPRFMTPWICFHRFPWCGSWERRQVPSTALLPDLITMDNSLSGDLVVIRRKGF